MNLVVWLVVGGLMGWVVSVVMPRTPRQGGIVTNILVGVAGAVLGGWLLSPLFGGATINDTDFSGAGLLVSLGGAVVLLAVVNLVRRETAT
jgi:uncharacterized membrane protein YeaQ/YmgE (transglycosylase-associated protein family)